MLETIFLNEKFFSKASKTSLHKPGILDKKDSNQDQGVIYTDGTDLEIGCSWASDNFHGILAIRKKLFERCNTFCQIFCLEIKSNMTL
jgi:hypothetical protein